ncbi:MAG: NAD-dependent epimerase/dehydratase family protein [Thermoleophilia bacterium]
MITGVAGFIGSRLAERLLDDGWSVLGLDALTSFTPVAVKHHRLARLCEWGGFTFARRDLARDPLAEDLDGADVVFHLAGQPGVRGSFGPGFDLYVERNVTATQRLLETMVTAGARNLVMASSSSVYGDSASRPTPEDAPLLPRSPYGVTKMAVEGLARCYAAGHGIRVVALRYFTVFGPGQRPDMAFQRLCEAALGGTPFPLHGDGRQSRDVTYVDDVVEATVAAAGRGQGAYNIGGGSPATLAEAIATVAELAGAPVPVLPGPPAPGDVRDTAADIGRARRDLGWAPRVGLRDGLVAQLEATRPARTPALVS